MPDDLDSFNKRFGIGGGATPVPAPAEAAPAAPPVVANPATTETPEDPLAAFNARFGIGKPPESRPAAAGPPPGAAQTGSTSFPAPVPGEFTGAVPEAPKPVPEPSKVVPVQAEAVPTEAKPVPQALPEALAPGQAQPVAPVPAAQLPAAMGGFQQEPESLVSRAAKNIPAITRGALEPIVGSVETVVQGLENLLSIPERLIKHGDVTSGPKSWWGISDKVREAGDAFLKGSQLGISMPGPGDEYATMPGQIIGGLAGFAPMMFAGGGGAAESFVQKFATNLMTFGLVDAAKTTAQGQDPAAMLEAAKGSVPSAVLFTLAQSLPFAKIVSNPYLVRQLEGLATGAAMTGASAIGGDRDPISLAVQFGVGYGTHMLGTRGKPEQELARRFVEDFKKKWNLSDDEFQEVMDVFHGKVKDDPNAPPPDPAVAAKVQENLNKIGEKYGSIFDRTPQVETLTPEQKHQAIFGNRFAENLPPTDAIRALTPQIGGWLQAQRFYELYKAGDAETALKEFPEMSALATEQQRRAAQGPGVPGAEAAGPREPGEWPKAPEPVGTLETEPYIPERGDLSKEMPLKAFRKLVDRVQENGDVNAAAQLDDILMKNADTLGDLFRVPREERTGLKDIADHVLSLMARVEKDGDPTAAKELTSLIKGNEKTLRGVKKWEIEAAAKMAAAKPAGPMVDPISVGDVSTTEKPAVAGAPSGPMVAAVAAGETVVEPEPVKKTPRPKETLAGIPANLAGAYFGVLPEVPPTGRKFSLESAFGLRPPAGPAESKLAGRLKELESEFPGIDRDRAVQVLRSFPKAENNQVANMVASPEMFDRMVQSTLSAAEQAKMGGLAPRQAGLFEGEPQREPGGGRLFKAADEAQLARGLTTEQIQSRLGEKGAVSELAPDALPARASRGWLIKLDNGQMSMVYESKYKTLEFGPHLDIGEDYRALGVTAEDMTVVGSFRPVSFGNVIELARGAGLRTFDHETWHTIEHWLLNDQERAALVRDFGNNEEVRAEAYAKWTPKEAPNGIFQKILDFFQGLIKAVTGKVTGEDVFAAARSGELFGREAREREATPKTLFSIDDDAETRQSWIPGEGEPPSFKQFKAEMDKDGEAVYRRYIQPGNKEIPLYQGEKFTDRAGNQIIDEKGKVRFLSKTEIYQRFYDPQRPLQQPEGTEAVGRNPILPPEGTVEPPPNQTTQRETPGLLSRLHRNWAENASIRNVGELANKTKTSINEHLGWAAREMRKAVEILDKYDTLFKGMSQDDLMAFTDKAEMGKVEELSPELQEAAGAWRRLADGLHFLIADSKGGEFTYWQDWFPRLFKNPEQAEIAIDAFLKGRGQTMTGPEGMLKARTMLLLSNSIKPVAEGGLGLELAYPNYVDMMKAKIHESLRYLTGTYIKNDMEAAGFLQKGQEKLEVGVPQPKVPPGWVEIDDKSLRGYYAHPEVATALNKFMSKGLRGNAIYDTIINPLSAVQETFVGLSAFHAMFTTLADLSHSVGANLPRGIGAALTGRFDVAGSHLKDIAKTLNIVGEVGMGDKLLAEYRKPGSYPELRDYVDLMTMGGMRDQSSRIGDIWGQRGGAQDWTQMSRALSDVMKDMSGWRGVPRKLMRSVSWPIMGYLVPRVKTNAIFRRLNMELDRFQQENGRTPTREESINISQDVNREIDNIFGQMVYDNLGMTKGLRDTLKLWIGFPGWNIGSGSLMLESMKGIGNIIGQTAKGGADILTGGRPTWESLPRAQRTSLEFYLGMTLVTAVMGAVTMRLLSGRWPGDMKDVFMPQTGGVLANGQPERVRMPTYMRDILSLNHPMNMMAAKENFALRMFSEVVANQDYFGTQIVDPYASTKEQIEQGAGFAAKSLLPFGIQGWMKSETPESKALNLVGITPVPRQYTNTPAANVIDEYNKMMRATTTTKESAEQKKLKSELLKLAKAGDDMGFDDAASQAVEDGKITRQQVKQIAEESQLPPGLSRFTKLPLEWAMRAWDKANDQEKEAWGPFILEKIRKEKPENLIRLREPAAKLLRDMGPEFDDAADLIESMTIPPDQALPDYTGLGVLKPPPQLGDLGEVGNALAEALEKKLEGKVEKPKGTRVSTRQKKESPYSVLGM